MMKIEEHDLRLKYYYREKELHCLTHEARAEFLRLMGRPVDEPFVENYWWTGIERQTAAASRDHDYHSKHVAGGPCLYCIERRMRQESLRETCTICEGTGKVVQKTLQSVIDSHLTATQKLIISRGWVFEP